ncbi:hypothetical protein GCM10009006_33180 [Haloarcula argentinensis]|uniref:Uncharacterized protein n=1 Tax=Haloarcula argentinensis TaxID=43776 RepID=A0A830FW33_HALAR|nr:hypothetical protein GCM10009006_33180 [Haloarcula argentinensis]
MSDFLRCYYKDIYGTCPVERKLQKHCRVISVPQSGEGRPTEGALHTDYE